MIVTRDEDDLEVNNYFKVVQGSTAHSIHIFNDLSQISTKKAYAVACIWLCMTPNHKDTRTIFLTCWKSFVYQGYNFDLKKLKTVH